MKLIESPSLREVVESIIAIAIIAGLIATALLGIENNETLQAIAYTIIGYFFGKNGSTNGAYNAGKIRGFSVATEEKVNHAALEDARIMSEMSAKEKQNV